jgi:hypothetical protein
VLVGGVLGFIDPTKTLNMTILPAAGARDATLIKKRQDRMNAVREMEAGLERLYGISLLR